MNEHELPHKSLDFKHERYFFPPLQGRLDNEKNNVYTEGGEGTAFPLLNEWGTERAYFKTFTNLTDARRRRTAWLIQQSLSDRCHELLAAPHYWLDTRTHIPQIDVATHFEGFLAGAAYESAWDELLLDITTGSVDFPWASRKNCVTSLVRVLAILEELQFVHGDLSSSNIFVDIGASTPIYLIDFDAFVWKPGEQDPQLTLSRNEDNTTLGTDGYIPKEVLALQANGEDPQPTSDRYARDMLLLELLYYDAKFEGCAGDSPEDAQHKWALLQTLLDENRDGFASTLFKSTNLQDILAQETRERYSSKELAEKLKITLEHQNPLKPFDASAAQEITEVPRVGTRTPTFLPPNPSPAPAHPSQRSAAAGTAAQSATPRATTTTTTTTRPPFTATLKYYVDWWKWVASEHKKAIVAAFVIGAAIECAIRVFPDTAAYVPRWPEVEHLGRAADTLVKPLTAGPAKPVVENATPQPPPSLLDTPQWRRWRKELDDYIHDTEVRKRWKRGGQLKGNNEDSSTP